MTLKGNPGGSSHYELYSDGTAHGDCETLDWDASGGIDAETLMKLRFMGRAIDHAFPHLAEEADRKSGTVVHTEPPLGCDIVVPDDPTDPDDPTNPTDPTDPDDDPTDPSDPTDPTDPGDDPVFPEGPGLCAPVQTIGCAETVYGDTSGPDAGTGLSAYPCNVGNYDAPELVYEFTAPHSGFMTFALQDAQPTVLNHDLFVLDGGGGSCSAEFCLAQGFNSVEFDAVGGMTYYLVVDGYWDQMGPFEVQMDCG